MTMRKRISDESGQAGADRAFFVGVIVAGVALRVRTARIWIAQVVCNRGIIVIYVLCRCEYELAGEELLLTRFVLQVASVRPNLYPPPRILPVVVDCPN